MTLIVGLRCSDGVILAADSGATFAVDGGRVPTIMQQTEKIELVGDHTLVAGTGPIGMIQRFASIVHDFNVHGKLSGDQKLGVELASAVITNFQTTFLPPPFNVGALLATKLGKQGPHLWEFETTRFQPEYKEPAKLWYVAMGSGQMLADAYLAFMREAFWKEGPPTVADGLFAAMFVMDRVITSAPGGLQYPVKIGTIRVLDTSKPRNADVKILSPDELSEHQTAVRNFLDHCKVFKKEMQAGSASAPAPPAPPHE